MKIKDRKVEKRSSKRQKQKWWENRKEWREIIQHCERNKWLESWVKEKGEESTNTQNKKQQGEKNLRQEKICLRWLICTNLI